MDIPKLQTHLEEKFGLKAESKMKDHPNGLEIKNNIIKEIFLMQLNPSFQIKNIEKLVLEHYKNNSCNFTGSYNDPIKKLFEGTSVKRGDYMFQKNDLAINVQVTLPENGLLSVSVIYVPKYYRQEICN